MSKEKELVKNTFIIFIGKFCSQFLSFLLIPIYTHFLSTSDYGYVDLVQTIIMLLIPVMLLRLDSSVFRFLVDVRKSEEEKCSIISSSLIFMIAQMILFLIVFLFLDYIIHFDYSVSICINVIFVAFSSILLQISRGLGDNKGYSIASIIAGFLTICFTVLFLVVLDKNASYILIASIISNMISSIYLIIRNKLYQYTNLKHFDKVAFSKMLKYSIPMIPDGVSWWIVNVSDRSLISFVLGTSFNGIYAISSKFSNILSAIFQIFNMSWQESITLHINDEDINDFFTKIINTCYKSFYLICLEIMISIPIVFKFFIGQSYNEAYIYIPILLLGNLYSAMANIFGGVYIAMKETNKVAKTTVLAAITNILINLFLIKYIGLLAAAISTLVSYTLLLIYRYMDVKKIINMKFNFKFIFFSTIIYICVSLIYYLYFNNVLINIICFCMVTFIIVIVNRNVLKKVFLKLRKKV